MNRSRDYHEVRAAVFYELASAGNPPLNSMGSSAKDQFKMAEAKFGPVKDFRILYAYCALGGTPADVKVKVNRTKGSYEETLSFYGKENPGSFHSPALLKVKP